MELCVSEAAAAAGAATFQSHVAHVSFVLLAGASSALLCSARLSSHRSYRYVGPLAGRSLSTPLLMAAAAAAGRIVYGDEMQGERARAPIQGP